MCEFFTHGIGTSRRMGNRAFHFGRRVREVVTLSAAIAAAQLVLFPCAHAFAQRTLGIDVSAWQGNLSQANWNTLRNTNNRQFVFIRSSRGGTTGFYNQSDPDNNNGQNTFSQRYDDPYFVQNITRATSRRHVRRAVPLWQGRHSHLPGPGPGNRPAGQHNAHRPRRSQSYAANGRRVDAAGYLLPVYDLESGNTQRSRASLSAFAVAFSNRIYEVMGIRPMVYLSSSYANDEVDSSVAAAMPNLWIARWPNQTNPNAIDVHNINPPAASSYPNAYGVWNPSYPNTPTPHPWKFWQYASTARLSGYANGTANIDVDVANGGIEFVKDYLVPALWMNDTSGEWTSLTNWNSGQTPVAPVQGPGQVPRVGPLTLPTARLPDVNDTVILERPNANITVTLELRHAQHPQTVRARDARHHGRLAQRQLCSVGGFDSHFGPVFGTGYAQRHWQFERPHAADRCCADIDARWRHAGVQHNQPDAAWRNAGKAYREWRNAHLASLSGTTATIAGVAGPGISGVVDLGNDVQTIHVADGAAAVDVAIDVPVVNGALTKIGPGTLLLNATQGYAGNTAVQAGTLSFSKPNLAELGRRIIYPRAACWI